MVELNNYNRNVQADEARIGLWRRKPVLWRIFTADEARVLRSFLRPHAFAFAILTGLSFGLAALQGMKALLMVGVIKGLVASPAELARLLSFSLLGRTYDLGRWAPAATREGFLILLFLLLLGAVLLTAGVKLLNVWLLARLQLRVIRDLRAAALGKIFSFDLDFFSQASSGELIFLMNTEVSRFSNIIALGCEFFTYGILTLIFALSLAYLYWDFTLVVFVAAALFFALHTRIDARLKEKSWIANLSKNRLSHFFHQIIYGIKMIRIGGMEEWEKRRYFKEHRHFERQTIQQVLLRGVSMLGQELAGAVVLLLVFLYLWLARDGAALLGDPGRILAYLFLLTRTLNAITGLHQTRTSVIETYGPLARVVQLLLNNEAAAPTRRETTDGTAAQARQKETIREPAAAGARAGLPAGPITHLAVRKVSYRYRTAPAPALEGISLEFPAGRLSALVGFSGSGKSTLLDLLSGLRWPGAGEVRINDVPLAELDAADYRRLLGYVNQEPIIFHDTVRANVAYFRPEASEAEIWEALRLAAAEEFVRSLPQGLETGVGERGLTVSGGERQRLGLARVFLQDAPILLLDEATNALDYDTEMRIYRSLEALKRNRIVIAAAHRLSAVRDFDWISVLHRGRVHEAGTHAMLMEEKSLYFHLIKLQEDGMLDTARQPGAAK
ncbi:MAG: ABC transporter ATP-binding protein [Candidatus Tectomicrobia bacterium]|nr:ABC transporter ATP-binding protein [Candidatus Tectomicrobia bacterium]